MKRFAWRLQRVLDIKKKEEQIKRTELLAITEQLAKTQGELLVQKMMLKNIINDLNEEPPAQRLGKQKLFLECSAVNDSLIRKLKNKIDGLKKQQKEKIAEVLKVKRYKEGLEKLRAEAKTEFITEQEKLEQKQADELTTMRFARKIIQQDITGQSNRLESSKQLIAK